MMMIDYDDVSYDDDYEHDCGYEFYYCSTQFTVYLSPDSYITK